jgi:hypothetical protein
MRSPSEVRQLEERLLRLIATTPGLGRVELAEMLGVGIREIDRPMINLIQSGRVTRSGHRIRCRYWPAAVALAGSAPRA